MNQTSTKSVSPMKSSILLKSLTWIFLLISVIILSWSCYYDSEEYLYPKLNTSCDTTNVTFSGTVKPILQQFCYTCHSNRNFALGGSIKLEDYSDVKIKADDGHLYGSIAHLSGFSPMPLGGTKLDDCNLLQIKVWIDSGSPNN